MEQKTSFLDKLRKIWELPELRSRILLTLMMLLVFRLGSLVVLPGIDSQQLKALVKAGGDSQGLLGLLNTFTGGSFFMASIFALGIMPYISASIIVQLLGFAVPYFQKLQKEGENGQRLLNQITRVITIAIAAVQGSAYLNFIKFTYGPALLPEVPAGIFWLSNLVILTCGTIFCMWLGEKITDKGLGNGISLLITVGIVVSFPQAIWGELQTKQTAGGGLVIFVLEIAVLIAVIMASIAIVQAVRKIKTMVAKHMVGRTAAAEGAEPQAESFLPIKLNAAGVMPIIFAQALMFIPTAIAGYFESNALDSLSRMESLPYNLLFFILVVVFTFVYTALVVNPQQYAESLRQNNAFIPRVKPGQDTVEYIDAVASRITFPGAIALGFIAIIPGIAMAFAVSPQFANFFGGTSLLILVSVVMDTNQQLQTHLISYENVEDSALRIRRGGTTTKEVSL